MLVRLNEMARERQGVDWARVGRLSQDVAWIALTTLFWLAGLLLGILGCGVLIFLLLSGGTMEGFFFHIDNMTSRYVEADHVRRATFDRLVIHGFVILLFAGLALRGPAFMRRLRAGLAKRGEAS